MPFSAQIEQKEHNSPFKDNNYPEKNPYLCSSKTKRI